MHTKIVIIFLINFFVESFQMTKILKAVPTQILVFIKMLTFSFFFNSLLTYIKIKKKKNLPISIFHLFFVSKLKFAKNYNVLHTYIKQYTIIISEKLKK